jgi:hypothetical protein
MARNGSGTYSLPAGNPVVTSTTISSTWANTTLSDIATALTASIAADGQTPVTANLPMGGHKLTGLSAGTTSGDSVRWDEFGSIPRSTTVTTVSISDKGKCIAVSAGITIPNAVFAAGDSFSIYNDSAAAVTITQGASLTLRQAGTTLTGNRTLAPRGFITVWMNSASEAILMGAGVT